MYTYDRRILVVIRIPSEGEYVGGGDDIGQHVVVAKPIDLWSLGTTCLVSYSFPCLGRGSSKAVYSNNTTDYISENPASIVERSYSADISSPLKREKKT